MSGLLNTLFKSGESGRDGGSAAAADLNSSVERLRGGEGSARAESCGESAESRQARGQVGSLRDERLIGVSGRRCPVDAAHLRFDTGGEWVNRG